jgi:hypothetical protein
MMERYKNVSEKMLTLQRPPLAAAVCSALGSGILKKICCLVVLGHYTGYVYIYIEKFYQQSSGLRASALFKSTARLLLSSSAVRPRDCVCRPWLRSGLRPPQHESGDQYGRPILGHFPLIGTLYGPDLAEVFTCHIKLVFRNNGLRDILTS